MVSVIAGSCAAAVSGGQGAASGSPAVPAAARAAGVGSAGVSSGAGRAVSPGGRNETATAVSVSLRDPAVAATPPRLVVPDVIAAVPGGVTAADLARLRRIGQVRSVLLVAGARITVNGRRFTVLGATAAALRAWMPPRTAANDGVWQAFAKGELITTASAARAGGLRSGGTYAVSAAVRTHITFGTTAALGVAGVDGIVDAGQAEHLGLAGDAAVLINAPAADMATLTGQVRAVLGHASRVIRLVPVTVSTTLPVDTHAPAGRPASYLSLYQESAARYCPGLSWTVLAAIGQIESGDGADVGPSAAGALGPMQFLPSTWKTWGITAFGETGAPDIMDPFDAVPAAARMLCADGAAGGSQGLRQAIFDYNHASWYVDEVLTLASEYAAGFG